MKFLKREKKSDFDELDLPPAPPSLDSEFAGLDEGMELPEIPDFPEEKISAPNEPDFDLEKDELPELKDDIPELGQRQEIQPISMPTTMPKDMPAPELKPVEQQPYPEDPRFTPLDGYPKIERKLFAQEKAALRERPSGKSIYVKVGKFKAALGSINVVRSDLRKSEDALMKLENIKNSKDRSFDRIRNSLDDLQRKLIFIDKTLFKED